MTNSIGEIEDNDVLFIIGSNATEAHPIIGNKMKKAAQKGAKLIVIDPRKTELATLAKYHLSLKSGTDAALINGLMHIIIKENWQDEDYIEERCTGFESLKENVANYPPELVEKITGISQEMLYKAAKLYAKTKKAGIFYTLGITEHTTGTDNVMNLANLGMLTGHIGFENAGINPLRGQNNVQGACDMAALPNYFPGYKQCDNKENVEIFEKLWGTKLNDKIGLRIPEMLDGAMDGIVKGMYVMGEDPVLTDPDANHVRKAMSKLELLVVQNIFLTETAKLADVVLPATAYAEKDGTFTNTERRVQRVRKAVDGPNKVMEDWKIVASIAKKLGYKGFDYTSAEEIFEEIRKAIPSYAGITYNRIEKDGLQWGCPTLDSPGSKYLHSGEFTRGKGLMLPIEYLPPAELVDEDYPILMNTGRMLYHYNVSTRISDTLESIAPVERVEIHPEDAKKYELDKDSIVRVTSRRGTMTANVRITKRVQPGTIFSTFHFHESPVNELTNSAYDPVTKTAEYKVTAVKLAKEA